MEDSKEQIHPETKVDRVLDKENPFMKDLRSSLNEAGMIYKGPHDSYGFGTIWEKGKGLKKAYRSVANAISPILPLNMWVAAIDMIPDISKDDYIAKADELIFSDVVEKRVDDLEKIAAELSQRYGLRGISVTKETPDSRNLRQKLLDYLTKEGA